MLEIIGALPFCQKKDKSLINKQLAWFAVYFIAIIRNTVCVIRNSVNKSYSGNKVVREKSEMQLVRGEKVEQIQMLVTTAPLKYKDKSYVLVVLEDITELLELRSILPICVHCKKIRDDQEYWQRLEAYLYKHLDINFSHGVCPECMKEHYPDVSED